MWSHVSQQRRAFDLFKLIDRRITPGAQVVAICMGDWNAPTKEEGVYMAAEKV